MERKRNVGIVPFNVTLALRRSKYKGTRSRYRGALEPQSLATSFEWQNANVMVLRKGMTAHFDWRLPEYGDVTTGSHERLVLSQHRVDRHLQQRLASHPCKSERAEIGSYGWQGVGQQ